MKQPVAACVAELLGTFTLTFIGAGAIIANVPGLEGGGGGLVAIALAHGLALSMAVYATGHISGGHINPAVTMAMLITKRISMPMALAYVVSQCAGAAIAACALKYLYPATMVLDGKLGATLALDASGALRLGTGGTLMVEAILSFFLVTTVFGVAVDSRGPKNVYGFAIGLTIAMDILAAGPLTGASMNPARSFGPALVGGHWTGHSIYWLGPILGGAVAAVLYDAVLLRKDTPPPV